MENITSNTSEQFRNNTSVISREGKRNWIFPKKPKGRFYNTRTLVSVILLAFLFGAPFLRKGGEPYFLFNIVDRKFILFGNVFGPHDFFILLIGMISLVVFIVLFTVVFGRVFCGWVCPQTVFMEMVFRKIEYLIEGDASKQRALKASPWNSTKLFKKGLKHSLFFIISFIIANTFLAWIIGTDKLFKIITDPPSEHLAGLISITAFSFVFYGVFSWFREQACILVCPYGRLQGVLLDQNSIVIAYDHKRGEPRGKIRKNEEKRTSGDCIDCRQCVDVCPTGIDIRNGTQYECVNCTACIDACDFVMEKVKRPKGLIRFASAVNINEGRSFRFTARMAGYSAVLVILLSVFAYMLFTRTEVDITLLRTPGLLYQLQPDGKISNLFDLKITNKTFKALPVTVELKNMDGEIKMVGDNLTAPAQQITGTKFLLVLNEDDIKSTLTPVTLVVKAAGKPVYEVNSSFLGRVEDENPAEKDNEE